MTESLYRSSDPFGTHQKFLEMYIRNTTGDIIEFGAGYSSTPLILYLIKGTNRKLISLENNIEWINNMKKTCPKSDNHIYIYITDWKKELEKLKNEYTLNNQKFSIAFIDSSPWDARITAMNLFRDISEYIFIHDVDIFPKNNIIGKVIGEHQYDFSDVCENFNVYFPDKPWPYITGPPTLVFSEKYKLLD